MSVESDLRDHKRRERNTAQIIAFTAWRYSNPAAGTFNPVSDAGHRRMVDRAIEYLRDGACLDKQGHRPPLPLHLPDL